MKLPRLAAAVLFAAQISGCGGNSTAIGVTVTPTATSAGSAVSVLKGGTQIFSAFVTGGSATTVYWQICLPVPITTPPTQPTMCTPIPGVTKTGTATINGYGTITQNGLYTAPTTLPQTNPFLVVATSTVNSTAFGTTFVRVDSGIRVQMIPTTATVGTLETFSLTANLTGSANTAITWGVNNVAGGNTTVGTIVPTGAQTALFTAPSTTETATVSATSSADPSQSGTSTITVSAAADATLTSIDPTIAAQGSVQQDIYLSGSNFFSTSVVLVNGTPVPTKWISTSLLRATLPAASLSHAGTFGVAVQQQNGDLSASLPLAVSTVRPVVVSSTPNSVVATTTGFGLSLTGGFFSQAVTNATFDGFPGTNTGVPAPATFTSSRQITTNIPAGGLATPGLYPLVVQNTGIAAGSSTSAVNIGVTPAAGTLLTSPTATVAVGSSPSAIAVDEADGLAVVVNTDSNSVSIINLSTMAVTTVAVGTTPTSVAVDGGLLAPLDPVAVVVNSGDNTLSTVDLKSSAVTSTVSLPVLLSPSTPYSVGINPVTHRGVVANTATNLATIFDLSTGKPIPPAGATAFPQIGGTNTNLSTGPQPQISVDPRLNWAVIAAGGGGVGIANFVDLGRNAVAGSDPGRAASVIGTLVLSTTSAVSGVGVNPETHQVLLTMPSLGNFVTFSLLDQSVSTIPFTNQGVTVNEPGYVAAAVTALPNIGIAVNMNGDDAAILDLQNHLVIEKVTLPSGSSPVAVAVDPATNQALVVNQSANNVSVLSLGPVRSTMSPPTPQIALSSPEIAFTSGNPLTLAVHGGGFASGVQVFLDGIAVPSTLNATSRQIVATVPASMLSSPRRYSVYVQNPGQPVISNVEDLIVIQSVAVGAQPFGVAIDTDCDVAAVTNSGDGTVSIVALTTNAAPPGKTCVSDGAIGTVGPPVSVGTTPQGIAVEPRLGLAVVANNGSDSASVVDLTETNPPATVSVCSAACTNVTAVAMNHDAATAEVTNVTNLFGTPVGNVSGLTLPDSRVPASATAGSTISSLDPNPTDVAVDVYGAYGDFFGISIAGQNQPSTVDIFNVTQGPPIARSTTLQLPTGIVFDPVNQVFVAANSLANTVAFVDPGTAITSFSQVGMNPTALDYNYQTSTLVTANNASGTMSIVDYVCPPTIVANCSAPLVRSILALGASPQFSVAIDPKLNLAVLTDQTNNRLLLVPLP